MQIKILFFGILKDVTSKSSENHTITANTSVSELKKELIKNYNGIEKYANFSVAINEAYAEDDTVLKENDVVALIPPVSGG